MFIGVFGAYTEIVVFKMFVVRNQSPITGKMFVYTISERHSNYMTVHIF
jgi:hypothetical protein